MGDMKNAYELTRQLHRLRPDDQRVKDNLEFLTHEVKNNKHKDNKLDVSEKFKMEETEKYRKLCRGESNGVPKLHEKHLKCWYKRTHPILMLKPQKVERLWTSPDIRLFRDILREEETERLKQLALPLLRRAKVLLSVKKKSAESD